MGPLPMDQSCLETPFLKRLGLHLFHITAELSLPVILAACMATSLVPGPSTASLLIWLITRKFTLQTINKQIHNKSFPLDETGLRVSM